MDRQEAVQKLATAGRLSIAHAEDLYDSCFSRPVVPQFVADWYEEHKEDLNESVWEYLINWNDANWDDFKRWMSKASDNKAITTLVNMHQFGYEVEKEPRYIVKIKANSQCLSNDGSWAHFNLNFKTNFTKSELERLGFGWVFDCPGVEVIEVE